ncbi:DUF2971 domain-containing protein [Rhodococcus erythropolis]
MYSNINLPETNKVFFSVDVPSHLAHYTRGSAFISICEKGELWAGRPDQMNDFKEQFHAIEKFLELARKKKDAAISEAEDEVVEYYELLENDDVIDYVIAEMPNYVISLTSEPDLLSQWRAYCPRSGGYSISIPTGHLNTAGNEQAFAIMPCVYKEEEVDIILTEILDFHDGKFRAMIAEGSTAAQAYDEVKNSMFGLVAFYGIYIKHESFQEEREWRLAYLNRAHVDPARLVFIEGEDGVRVFYKFKLKTGLCDPATAKPEFFVMVGPNARSKAAQEPAELVLEKLVGVGKANVYATSSTFR